MKTFKRILLAIFLICLGTTATLVIVSLWSETGEVLFPEIPTLFVIGLTAFLVWLVITVLDIKKTLENR